MSRGYSSRSTIHQPNADIPQVSLSNIAHEAITEAVTELTEELREHRMASEGHHDAYQYKKKKNKSKGDCTMGKERETVHIVGTGLGNMGGSCGYGHMGGMGYGWGIPPVGLMGMMPWGGGFGALGRGFGGGFGGGERGEVALINGGRIEGNIERQLEMMNDGMNSRFNDVNGDVRTSRIEGSIGGVKDQLGHMADRMFTMALSDKDSYYSIDKSILVGQKDIIASQLKCCCEQKEIAMSEGCKTRETIHCEGEKTRHLMGEIERARQAERLGAVQAELVESKGINSNLIQTGIIEKSICGLKAELAECCCKLDRRIDGIENHNQVLSNNLVNFGTIVSQLTTAVNSLVAGQTA